MEVRLQVGLLRYACAAGAPGLTVAEFLGLFSDVLDGLCMSKVAWKGTGQQQNSAGAFLARHTGESLSDIEGGCPKWAAYDVIVRFPRRIRLEKKLLRLQLPGAVGSCWTAEVKDRVPHGRAWKHWARGLVKTWSLESREGAHLVESGWEESDVLEGELEPCTRCVWSVDGSSVTLCSGNCPVGSMGSEWRNCTGL